MKVYRYDDGSNASWYEILIEEDSGERRLALVGLNNIVHEHIAKEVVHKSGIVRLVYGGGSSIPYKNADGTICEKWKEIIN